MEFYAQGIEVFMKTDAGPTKIATVNLDILTPRTLAKEIADALNAKFGPQ